MIKNLKNIYSSKLISGDLKLYELDANTLSLENLAGGTYKNLQLGNMYLENVHEPTTVEIAAITLADGGGSGSLSAGAYYYTLTWVAASGETGFGGTVAGPISPGASHKVQLTTIPVPTSALVVSKNLYRTTAGGDSLSALQLVANLAVATTSYLDNIADVSLGVFCNNINTTGGGLYYQGSKILKLNNDYSIIMGVNSGLYGSGWANMGFGSGSLNRNTSGNRNNFLGDLCLVYNTTGNTNVALGTHTLEFNVTGSANLAAGHAALEGNALWTTGPNQCVAVGTFAMASLAADCTAGQCVAIGWSALAAATSCTYNTVIGYSAGIKLTTGSYNVLVGSYVGKELVAQNSNVVVGASAAYNAASGSSTNVIIGSLAGYTGTTITSCVFLGYGAGYRQTGGSVNGYFILDNQLRTSAAVELTDALVFGTFNANAALQTFKVNGLLKLGQAIDSAAVADEVSFSSYDISAGHRALALSCEEVSVNAAAGASDWYLPVRINGATFKLLLHS